MTFVIISLVYFVGVLLTAIAYGSRYDSENAFFAYLWPIILPVELARLLAVSIALAAERRKIDQRCGRHRG